MSEIHLISHHLCPYVQRAVIVLLEKGLPHERTYIDLADRPAWFHIKSPLGRVPLLETRETVLFESQVIAEYLDEITPESLHPVDPLEKARQRAWIEFGSETLAAIGGFYSAPDADTFEQKRAALRQKFERITREISGPYFAGTEFQLIDGVWGTVFRYLDIFEKIGDFDLTRDLGALERWRQTVQERPSVQDAVPTGYDERLRAFLGQRNSHLGALARAVS